MPGEQQEQQLQQQQAKAGDTSSAVSNKTNSNEQAKPAQTGATQQKEQQKQQQQHHASQYGGGYQRPIGQGAPWPPPPYGPHHGMASAAAPGGWSAGSFDDGSNVPAAWGGYGSGYHHLAHQQQRRHYPAGGGVDGIERGMAGLKTGSAPSKDSDFPALSGGVAGGFGGNGGPSGKSNAPKSWAKIAAGSNSSQTAQPETQQQQDEQQQQQQPQPIQQHQQGQQFQHNKPRALGRGFAMPPPQMPYHHQQHHPAMFGPPHHMPPPPMPLQAPPMPSGDLDERIRSLMLSVNPPSLEVPENSEFYVIKSYSEDDIHRAIKYSIWCSTPHGNSRLNKGYQRATPLGGKVYLLFSVNGSGHFCGVAQMTSEVDNSKKATVWCQDKWQGQFSIAWLLVKDVPNSQLRHIRIVNNENKPVTNSRDCTQVPIEQGRQVLAILLAYRNSTSIFDDFNHYDRREQEGSSGPPM